jgi:hypothetical protein
MPLSTVILSGLVLSRHWFVDIISQVLDITDQVARLQALTDIPNGSEWNGGKRTLTKPLEDQGVTKLGIEGWKCYERS